MEWKRNRFWVCCLALWTLSGGVAWAETLTLTPAKDNTLYEDQAGAFSNGSGPAFFVGINGQNQILRGLLAFDLGAIPPGSTVHSVTLRLNQSNNLNNLSAPQTVSLRRARRDWGEGASSAGSDDSGGGGGSQAAAGDATWVHTFFPDERWDSAGGDFEGVVSTALPVGGNGFYTFESTAQLVADVQNWVNDPDSNFGWVLTGNESSSRTAKRFDSRENGDPGRRPSLTVDFTPAASPGAVAFAMSGQMVDEDSGVVAVTVVRSGGDEGQISVGYATRDGAAAAGSDYMSASGTLIFEAGQSERSIMVTILDDDVFEGDETLFVDLASPGGGATLGAPASLELTIGDVEDLTDALHFAQFGDGQGFSSQIILINTDAGMPVNGRLTLLRSDGSPFPAVLDGETLPTGVQDFRVPAGGLRSLLTGGQAPPEAGSATVLSDRRLAGVILFGGAFGLAGVAAGAPLPNGFLGPVENNAAASIETGVAVRNLETFPIMLMFELVDSEGQVLATASLNLPAMGHDARFVRQIDWTPVVDFSDFQGTVRVSSSGLLTATMIQTRPNQFATLPVVAR